MIKSTQQTVYFEARSITDGTRVSGLTVTATISKDGGAATVATNAPTELGTSGVYALTLTATETNATTLAVIPATTTEGVFLPLLTAEPVENVDLNGLATTANIASLQTHGDSAWSTADVSGLSTLTTADIPIPPSASSIATSVWNKDLAAYTLTNTYAGTIVNGISENMLRDSDKSSWAPMIANYVWKSIVPSGNSQSANTAGAMLKAIPTTSTIPPTKEEIAYAVAHYTIYPGANTTSIQGALETMYMEGLYIPTIKTHTDNIASDVWGAGARTLTASPTDISGLATSASVTALQTAVDSIPTTTYTVPTAAEITTAVWDGAGSIGIWDLPRLTASNVWSATTRTLTSSEGSGGATAQEVWEYTARTLTSSPTDLTGLATSSELTALQTHGDSTWSTADVSGLSTLTAQVVGLLGRWTVSGNTLTTYASNGTTALKTYTLTRDTDGEITSVTEVS